MENLERPHFPTESKNKIKGVTMTERPVSRSISVRQMWRTAVVCCWPGSVWESYGTGFACVHPSAQTHLSVRTRLSVSPRDEFLLTRKIVRLGETKERDPNRHSAPWSTSIPGVCCHRMYNPRLNWGWLPAGPDSQLNRGELVCMPETLPGQSSRLCLVYQSVTGFVYMWFQ